MKYIRIALLAGLICFAMPLAADDWWTETTLNDFGDGQYNAGLYVADTGIAGDGALQVIYLRDIDADGNIDLLVSNNRTGDIVTPGSAYYAYDYDALTFVDSLFGYNTSGNLILDYDNDGNMDIVLSAYDDEGGASNLNSRLYYGPGFDSATAKTFATNQAMAVSADDLDKDGDLDLVFSNRLGNNASIYFQGTASPQNLTCAQNYGNAIADLNEDGELDIVLAGLRGIVFYGPNFTSPDTVPGIDSLTDVSIADLNQDSILDIVFSAWGDSSFIVPGPNYNTHESVYTRNSRAVSIADLSSVDGDLDLVFSNWFGAIGDFDVPSFIYYGPDYSTTPPVTLPSHGSVGNTIGDFNGDRELDIFCANFLTPDSLFDTLSYVFMGPNFSSWDTVACKGAHMGTSADAGNLYTRMSEEIYLSSVFDAGDTTEWDSVVYTSVIPTLTDLNLSVQTGNVSLPDDSWSDWLEVSNGDTLPDSLASRYIRYRAQFLTNLSQAPRLEEVSISYPGLIDATPDSIISPQAEDVTDREARLFLFQVRNIGSSTVSFPVQCLLDDSAGTNLLDSTLMVNDVAAGDSALVIFGTFSCGPGDSLWVITMLSGDVDPGNDTLLSVLGPSAIEESPVDGGINLTVSANGTRINVQYTLPRNERILLAIYDASGRMVNLLDEGTREKGSYTITWDSRDQKGSKVSTGVYFLKLKTDKETLNRKFVLIE